MQDKINVMTKYIKSKIHNITDDEIAKLLDMVSGVCEVDESKAKLYVSSLIFTETSTYYKQLSEIQHDDDTKYCWDPIFSCDRDARHILQELYTINKLKSMTIESWTQYINSRPYSSLSNESKVTAMILNNASYTDLVKYYFTGPPITDNNGNILKWYNTNDFISTCVKYKKDVDSQRLEYKWLYDLIDDSNKTKTQA